MDDIMQKIQSVLSDKESMEQLSQLAQMFSQPSGEQGGQENSTQQSASPDMSSLFSSFSQNDASGHGNQSPSPQNDGLGLDIGTVMALQSIMSKASAPDKNRDFLIALKPLLKEESQRKIDKLVTIFKLMAVLPLLRESGLLGGDLLGIL